MIVDVGRPVALLRSSSSTRRCSSRKTSGKGLRDPLQAFGVPTEPWLFTIDESGRVAARLEGSFGVNSFRDAVQAAL